MAENLAAEPGAGPLLPPLALTLSRSRLGQQMLVSVGGEVDLATADSLRSYLLETAGQSSGIGVDLTGTTFLDSSGVRVLVHAAQRAADNGAAFFLVCPTDNTAVRRILEILQLQTVMSIVDSLPSGWPETSPTAG